MGKSKKGKSNEKSSKKMAKQFQKQLKKTAAGEEVIEDILADLEAKRAKSTEVVIKESDPPGPSTTTSGPCARSGHRMSIWKDGFLLFGGFNDVGIKTTYFNDMWHYEDKEKSWTKITLPSNPVLPPRSGGIFFSSLDLKHVYVYGGYSKTAQKKDIESGITHTEHYELILQGRGAKDPNQCALQRPSGSKPVVGCAGMSACRITGSQQKIFVFGGVHDEEVDKGEDLVGHFHDELYMLDLQRAKWTLIENNEEGSQIFKPCGRMHCGLAHLNNKLYVYGGIKEEGKRRITLDDLSVLDQSTESKWSCLYEGTYKSQDWQGSDDEDEETDDESDYSDDDEEIDAPVPKKKESFEDYFKRCMSFWSEFAADEEEEEGAGDAKASAIPQSTLVTARNMAQQFYGDHSKS